MEQQAKTFEFSSYSSDLKSGHFRFSYAVILHDGRHLNFTEKIVFPAISKDHEIPQQLLDSVLHSLHLALGVTYWKLYCPPEIVIKTKQLTKDQAEFWNTVYTKGLGEFFYQNKIQFKNLIQFPYVQEATSQAVPFSATDRALVGIGGGKDSIVVHELLKKNNIPHTGLVVEIQKQQPLIDEVLQIMNLEAFKPKRVIDPLLFVLNKLPNSYNGHVPVSAINAFIGVLSALLFDYRYFVVGNEHSSDVGNVEWQGEMVNHQWSKSVEFEKLMQNYLKENITTGIEYFSLLRPWYELKIVQEFSKYGQYFPVFSSCNRNFRIIETKPEKWCGHCAKCCFVFSLLAAFLPKEKLLGIFGKNLFADSSLNSLFKEILGLEGFKPFDCVGTPDETKVAFYLAHERGEYESDVIMQMFVKEVLPGLVNIDASKVDVFTNHEMSLIPEKFKTIV